jgi:hypothetical protein
MSSLSPKDRVSLCTFTFSDGRRCRTPRISSHPHFCFYHAQKEARASAADKLGNDLAFFFSGDYLSACDLSIALARLIPAVVHGDIKSKTAHTVAYLVQTLMQAIHVSQHEYINAFGSDAWRKAIRNSVNDNYDYRFPPIPQQPQPPQPQPQQPAEPPENCHSERSEESASPSNSSLATHHSPLPQAPQSAPLPHTPLPPTGAEFVQHILAGLQAAGGRQLPQPAQATQPAPAQTRSPIATQAPPTPTRAAVPTPSPTSSQATQTPSSRACHPERSKGSCLDPAAPATDETHFVPATPVVQPVPSAAQPNNPPPTGSPTPRPVLPLDSRALHFDHNCRLLIDGKPV